MSLAVVCLVFLFGMVCQIILTGVSWHLLMKQSSFRQGLVQGVASTNPSEVSANCPICKTVLRAAEIAREEPKPYDIIDLDAPLIGVDGHSFFWTFNFTTRVTQIEFAPALGSIVSLCCNGEEQLAEGPVPLEVFNKMTGLHLPVLSPGGALTLHVSGWPGGDIIPRGIQRIEKH